MFKKIIDGLAIVFTVLLFIYFYVPLIATASFGEIILLAASGLSYSYIACKLFASFRD